MESSYVDVVSSPIRESFLRKRTQHSDEKLDSREDFAAVLLSLALPRIGVSPLVTAFPSPPCRHPETPVSEIAITGSREMDASVKTSAEKELPDVREDRGTSPGATTLAHDQSKPSYTHENDAITDFA